MMWMKEGMTGFMTDSSPRMDENLAYCPGGREGERERERERELFCKMGFSAAEFQQKNKGLTENLLN